MTALAYRRRYRAAAAPFISREHLFWLLILASGALALLYLYFIAGTVQYLMERKTAEAEVRDLSGGVSALEERYAELGNTLNREQALHSGLAEISDAAYVPRVSGLSMRTE